MKLYKAIERNGRVLLVGLCCFVVPRKRRETVLFVENEGWMRMRDGREEGESGAHDGSTTRFRDLRSGWGIGKGGGYIKPPSSSSFLYQLGAELLRVKTITKSYM
jgi:hypothetical protein